MAQSSMMMLLRHDHTYDPGNITFSILIKRSIVPKRTQDGGQTYSLSQDM